MKWPDAKTVSLSFVMMPLWPLNSIADCEKQRPNPFFEQLPNSPVIAGIRFDHGSHRREAPGSDNWPVTWAADGNLYATWGDGGGFGGSNQRGRVSFGTARIEGNAQSYIGTNVHGGFNGEHPGQKAGYSWGLTSVSGTLYMWAGESRSELFYSRDLGASWNSAGWSFDNHDGPFSMATVLNFGKDNADARDNYVYVYAPSAYSGWPSQSDGVDLARVHKDHIEERSAYEFFAGMSDGISVWSIDIKRRKPVFRAQDLVHWTINIDYIDGLDRYLLSFTSNGFDQTSNLVVLDAPTPWGPWTVVNNSPDLCRYGYTYAFHFPQKWQSDDGSRFTMIFSGGGDSDSWNTINGRFELQPRQ